MTTLLVVDDEPSVRKLLQRYLESRGFDVGVADNGVTGWHEVREHHPDLVLSDVSMPEMDGYELCRTIRRNPKTATIPVILLSAHREADAMVAGYECGADDYVAKPVDMEVLKHKIDALLRRTTNDAGPALPILGKLICVTSAKGGVGVSTLVANLSILLCRRNETVCAYDLSIEHGDLPVLLDLQPKMTLADLARDLPGQGDALQWDDYLIRHASGPRLLAAPARPPEASGIGDEQVSGITARLRNLHDYTLVDVPPGYGDITISAYETADRIVVITSPEITALRHTRELLAVMSSLGIPDERVLVVLNRTIEVSGVDTRRVETFLKRPVAATIPNGGPAFIDAVTTGRPVVLDDKRTPAIAAITELAGLL